jgi:hypothetical protein
MVSETETDFAIPSDASLITRVTALVLDVDRCARYIDVEEILPPLLAGTKCFKAHFLASGTNNISHLAVVFDAETGETVATYAGVSLFGGS